MCTFKLTLDRDSEYNNQVTKRRRLASQRTEAVMFIEGFRINTEMNGCPVFSTNTSIYCGLRVHDYDGNTSLDFMR